MSEMLQQAIIDGAVNFLFGAIVIAVVALLMVMVMFGALAVRAIWLWLTGESVNSLIVKSERKALR